MSGQPQQPQQQQAPAGGGPAQPILMRPNVGSAGPRPVSLVAGRRPDKVGWLYKRGGKKGEHGKRKRWFVLRDDRLCYFENPKQVTNPKGVIALKECIQVKQDNPKKYAFSLVATYRTFFLFAENAAEYNAWIKVLEEKVRMLPQKDEYVAKIRIQNALNALRLSVKETRAKELVGELTSQLSLTSEQLQSVQSELAQREEVLASKQAEVERVAAEKVRELESRDSQIWQWYDRVVSLQAELDEATAKLATLQEESESHAARAGDASADASAKAKELAVVRERAERATKRVSTLERAVQEKDAQVTALQSQVADLKVDLSKARGDMKKVEQKVKIAEGGRAATEERMATVLAEIDELKLALRDEIDAHSKMQHAKETAEEAARAKDAVIAERDAEIARLNSRLTKIQELTSALNG